MATPNDMTPAENTPLLRPVPDEPAPDPAWDGITKPRTRGGSSRFLTDVIIELGLVERERVEQGRGPLRTAALVGGGGDAEAQAGLVSRHRPRETRATP